MVREKSGALEPIGRERESSALGTEYGRYQLLKKLAAGGMAEVYLARQSGLEGFEKLIVVKRILPHLASDEEFVQMFLNEARIAARFNHANIVQIYDLGRIEGSYFIGMEYVHGEDLGRIMRKAWNAGTWIPPQLALRVIAQACEGLYYAHTKTDESGKPLNVVHRDISPQNILVSFDGGVKIVDFGIAKAADSNSGTRNGTIKGKYAYMSPEQAQGKPVDGRTDVFALGLVLYELLTGVRPLKRDTDIQTLQAALACEIDPPSKVASITDSLDPLVMQALTREAPARYQNAREFQMAIEEYLVQNQLAASSVHLSEFMKTLFADRLEEEAKAGRPMPSVTESQQSFPALPAAPRTGPVPSLDNPRRNSDGVRRSALAAQPPAPAPAPQVADDLEDDPDDAPTTQEVEPAPRRKTGTQRRATGEGRRISGEKPKRPSSSEAAAPAPTGRTRSRSQVASGMPEAPARRTSDGSRARDESWKDANRADPRGQRQRRGGAFPVVAILFLAAVTAGLVYRGEVIKFLAAHGVALQPGAAPMNVSAGTAGSTISLATNIQVEVEINGEVVGTTPVRNYPVKPGNVAVHFFDAAQGIDKTLSYAVKDGESVTQREEFAITRVQFKTDRSAVQAEVFLNGKRIGLTGSAPISMAAGEYDFTAKADNGTLEGSAHATIRTADRVNFVTFTLHRK